MCFAFAASCLSETTPFPSTDATDDADVRRVSTGGLRAVEECGLSSSPRIGASTEPTEPLLRRLDRWAAVDTGAAEAAAPRASVFTAPALALADALRDASPAEPLMRLDVPVPVPADGTTVDTGAAEAVGPAGLEEDLGPAAEAPVEADVDLAVPVPVAVAVRPRSPAPPTAARARPAGALLDDDDEDEDEDDEEAAGLVATAVPRAPPPPVIALDEAEAAAELGTSANKGPSSSALTGQGLMLSKPISQRAKAGSL